MKKRTVLSALILLLLMIIFPLHLLSKESALSARQRQSEQTAADYTKADVDVEVLFGREVAARVLGRFGLYENADVQRYLNLVGNALTEHTNRPELAFRVAVLNTSEINSYSAPGGYLFITKGALCAMQDEAELAGMLAHEIAHIANRDVVRYLNIRSSDASPEAGIAQTIGGPLNAVTLPFLQPGDQNNSIEKALEVLFINGYKQEDEFAADQSAAYYTAFAGYDPQGLVRLLERIEAQKGLNDTLLDKTHPTGDKRKNRFAATIQEEGLLGSDAKSFADRFAAMKTLIQ